MISRKFITRAAGIIILALSLWYVGQSLYRVRGQMCEINAKLILVILILSLAYFVGNVIRAVNWKTILTVLSGKTFRLHTFVGIYLRTEIVKYVPSNIMHFAGRHLLCRENGVSHKVALASNIADMLFILTAAAVVAVPSLFTATAFPVYTVVSGVLTHALPAALAAAICVMIFLAILWIKRHLIGRYLNKKNIVRILSVLVLDMAVVILNGLLFYAALVMFSLAGHAPVPVYTVVALYALCWMAGFVVPGSPGGLGVREALIVLVFSGVYPDAAVIAILMRIVSVAGDAFALCAGLKIR